MVAGNEAWARHACRCFSRNQSVCVSAQVYLHLLDPQRCIALANRTERVLVKEQEIPGAWWNPVPNNEMVLDVDDGKTWVKS